MLARYGRHFNRAIRHHEVNELREKDRHRATSCARQPRLSLGNRIAVASETSAQPTRMRLIKSDWIARSACLRDAEG